MGYIGIKQSIQFFSRILSGLWIIDWDLLGFSFLGLFGYIILGCVRIISVCIGTNIGIIVLLFFGLSVPRLLYNNKYWDFSIGIHIGIT